MRYAILAAGLAVAFGLSACDSSKTSATTAAAPTEPAAPKYSGRSQQMYQGQEMIEKVDSASIKVGKGGTLEMEAKGSVPMAGYKKAGFLPRINPEAPKDGVYEVDAVAEKPASGTAASTPIEIKDVWDHYPADSLKGIKVISKTNSVVAMLPGK
ncbi:hypothetical protein [Phenylobacterium sp.]|jgi:hypothetical protein|uniref:hypothetical protein n=1 Tax=Phenylobacterium sp. TaxID=1871053 RepID=UPI002F3E4E03